MGPVAHLLPDGKRLHLQHGPIDLIIGADGERDAAFQAAHVRFQTILDELVAELDALRTPISPITQRPKGAVAQRMHYAAMPYRNIGYLTRMAAVAGAVADEILAAMCQAANLRRAYVNNGGDIALHLTDGTSFKTEMVAHDGRRLGQIEITSDDNVCGIATSGRHGRSQSLGIADSVTVLASTAVAADIAATLIGNAVDLPGHAAIQRTPANKVWDDSDLGTLPVVTGCGKLTTTEAERALSVGRDCAQDFCQKTLVQGAALFLQDQSQMTDTSILRLHRKEAQHA